MQQKLWYKINRQYQVRKHIDMDEKLEMEDKKLLIPHLFYVEFI